MQRRHGCRVQIQKVSLNSILWGFTVLRLTNLHNLMALCLLDMAPGMAQRVITLKASTAEAIAQCWPSSKPRPRNVSRHHGLSTPVVPGLKNLQLLPPHASPTSRPRLQRRLPNVPTPKSHSSECEFTIGLFCVCLNAMNLCAQYF